MLVTRYWQHANGVFAGNDLREFRERLLAWREDFRL